MPDQKLGRRESKKEKKGRRPPSENNLPQGKLSHTQKHKNTSPTVSGGPQEQKEKRRGAEEASAKSTDKSDRIGSAIAASLAQTPKTRHRQPYVTDVKDDFEWDDGPT